MKISIIPNTRSLAVIHGKDSVKLNYSVWTTLNRKTDEEIFGPTNEFLATLSEEVQQNMFDAYSEAADVFNEINSVDFVKSKMQELAAKLMKDVDPAAVNAWAQDNANFYKDPPPLPSAVKNPPEMTYEDSELVELRCLCVATKILTPMIGSYVDSLKGSVHNTHKERRAAEIYLATRLVDFPAHIRFDKYITTLANRRHKSIPMALRFGTASIDLDKFLMGLSIVRRFTIARLRSDEDGSIIAYIYTFLEEKMKSLGKEPWREKFSSGSDNSAEAEGYADQYRIPEEVEQDVVDNNSEYFKSYDLIIRDLKLTPEQTEVYMGYIRYLTEHEESFIVTPPIHYSLCALALRHIIDYPVIEKIDKPALISAIAATAAVFGSKGAKDVEDLLTAMRKDNDPSKVPMDFHIKRLTRTLELELSRCYPYITQAQINANLNPGKLAIDNIIKAILAFDWDVEEDLGNIRLSIAKLIIDDVPEEYKVKEK